MRVLPIVFMLLPSIAMSDQILLSGKVTDVTVYPLGASVTRRIAFKAPKGAHELIIADLPLSSLDGLPRLSLTGATMGAVQMRKNYVPPRAEEPSAALEAALAAVESIEEKMRTQKDQIAEILLENDAVEARIGFLQQIGEGEKLALADLAMLRDLSRMVGEEILAARKVGYKAKIAARKAQDSLADLADDLEQAKKRVTALVPEEKERAFVSVSVTSDREMDGVLTLRHFADATWMPTYDFRLSTQDTPQLEIDRGALVQQFTGENWRGVNLTLSTVQPSLQTKPSQVYEQRLRIRDQTKPLSKRFSSDARGGLGQLAAPVVVMEAAQMGVADYDGLSVTYSYETPIDIASNADTVRIALGQLATSATVFAKAVPQGDKTAFLMAEIVNDMNEIILPSQEASFYLDGQYVGQQVLEDVVAVGAKEAFSFGPIEGLRLSRVIADRKGGGRGYISRSNTKLEIVDLGIENLTERNWDIRLIDRVPYSEQEDLEIEWEADMRPSVVDLNGRRGVLQWEFEMASKSDRTITLSHEVNWPDGKELQ